MTLTGWTLPQTRTGRAATVPPPPWHYSGDIIAIDFTADPARVAERAPRSVGPGWVYTMAFSVIGGTSMPLRAPR